MKYRKLLLIILTGCVLAGCESNTKIKVSPATNDQTTHSLQVEPWTNSDKVLELEITPPNFSEPAPKKVK